MKRLAFSTPLGFVWVQVQEGRVVQVRLGGRAPAGVPADPSDPQIARISRAFSLYLFSADPERRREGWHLLQQVPVDLATVPPIYRRILETLRRTVPFGRLVTYGELARRTGTHPRVVGQAMARNPVPILVPCHRVVSARGLGGFTPGLHWKRYLWQLEGIKTPGAAGPAARD